MSAVLKDLQDKIGTKKTKDPPDVSKDPDKAVEKESKEEEDEGGWASVKAFFMGQPGVVRAKKFIKFLNILTALEEPSGDAPT